MILGLSLGHRTVREAEHWLAGHVAPLGLPDLVACTHLVATPYPHVALTVAAAPDRLAGLPDSPPGLRAAARRAAGEHAARRSGRAVHYPGSDRMVGTLTVADLLAASAIERVVVLGGGAPPGPETPLHTRDFVRPQWRAGELVLVATPRSAGGVAPFEVPDPTPCCADH
ncbi:hypothetical protein ACVCAH_24260 [Micromonospora sp. LZ34]